MIMALNYIDQVAQELADDLGMDDRDLLRLYALLVLVKGTETTLEDVHDAWAVWMAEARPDHRSLIPFSGLRPEVQVLDSKYAEAIHRVARKRDQT
jgi:hypothetical protein